MSANITPMRVAAMLALTLVLFIGIIILAPDALPIFPAVLVPAIWVSFFAGGSQPSAQERRILVALLIAGVVAFGLGLAVWVAVE
ncbi:MAG: hypothetical protein R3C39_09565 [Dehalococcoidia bacterium]